MKVFRNRAEAGGSVDTGVYPWRVRQTPGADPHIPPAPIVRTDLEAQLAEALEAMIEATAPLPGECALCGWMGHEPACKAGLALKAFRGEGERG